MSIANNQACVTPKDAAEELSGPIRWENNETKGYCTCPGAHLHGENTGDRACIVYLNDVATISCFHESCADEVREANRVLRRAIANGQPVDPNRRVSKG